MTAPRRVAVLRFQVFLLPILAILLAIGEAGATAAPARGRPLQTDGHCDQIAAFVPVPVERARGYVPPSFTIVGEESGTASVLVTGGLCDPWLMDGAASPPLRFGLISVLAHPNESPPGADGYDLWWQFAHRRMARGFRNLGAPGERVRGISFELTPGPLGVPTEGHLVVPWEESRYTIDATISPAGSPPAAFPSTHWYEGPLGRVHGAHQNTEARASGAEIVIEVEGDTPLAELLGAERIQIAGGWLSFEHTAITRIVQPD